MFSFCFIPSRRLPRFTLFPYTTLFRSVVTGAVVLVVLGVELAEALHLAVPGSGGRRGAGPRRAQHRSEEHTSELQSHSDLVCRLLLEKKKLYDQDEQ